MLFGAGGWFVTGLYLISLYGLQIFVRYLAYIDFMYCYACKEMDSVNNRYDYIVVGSGSAGSIVASRLAEDEHVKVLLLEAGPPGSSLIEIPSFGLTLQRTLLDWEYRTVPQQHSCRGLENQVSFWPMGRVLGGTSILNNMIYTRGHPDDFESWFNSPDYDYETDILPYFKKLENSSITISNLPFTSKLSGYILEAAFLLGFSVKKDVLHAISGFGVPKATMKKGRRSSPAHQLKKFKNLFTRTNVLVEKVLLKENEARGVRYLASGEEYVAKATRGVILSAGVVGTPKILMLSGIGPAKHLKSVGVNLKIDLPVGDNLQDHVSTGFDLVLLNTSLGLSIEDVLKPTSAFKYFFNGNGPWTSTGCENVAFFAEEEEVPHLQFMVLPVGVSSDGGWHLRTLAGISDKSWDKYFSKIYQTAITILPIVLHPKSRGTVRLKDKNLQTPPLIDPNYLSEKPDVETLLEGIDIIKRVVATPSMAKLGAKLNDNIFPGCEKYEFDSGGYWECYVRHLTLTSYHPVGTCSMGQVVDYEFRVLGAKGLYVVDGSVLPNLPSGNINAAIMMMAEKAADVIKDHRKTENSSCRAKDVFVH